ncbi:MAG: DUF2752 domain-containing protein [Flavobacteriaceae bacterium]|jgi:hypothetical protein|nr:DUF2752 domain-containing protein [Flavobacteriaceae bacterium]|tara:strand:+ start:683 stop:1099 length:417 start_codon:yes stop_codon:yes gene_type:complete
MTLDRNKLYSVLFIACLAGYVWLYFSVTKNITEKKLVEVCIIKHATNIPCPSCGSTRSVISLTKGDFIGALKFNPIGYLVAIIMLIAPIWIIADTIKGTKTLFNFYIKTETYLKRPKIAITLILLVIINWIWNITKEI